MSTPNTHIRVIFLDRSLNILTAEKTENVQLKPETYILHSALHLGILSFDSCDRDRWILSFRDIQSVTNCVQTLRKDGINVTNVQKLVSERMHLESTITKVITNAEFPSFVANVENAMKNNKNV